MTRLEELREEIARIVGDCPQVDNLIAQAQREALEKFKKTFVCRVDGCSMGKHLEQTIRALLPEVKP